jgi:hypothetical protein
MNNMLYNNNNNLQLEQDLNFEPQENYEELSNQENSDNLLEKMEVTLNTFLNNLKKDDMPSYPDFTQAKKSKNLVPKKKNYNKPQNTLNINKKNNNYYNPKLNLVDSYKNILNSNLNKEEIDKLNLNINNKLSDLNNNIDEIKKNIENDSVYFEQRLKNLINIEDVKKCISEIQKQYENIISNLFESFLQYNASDKDTENIILLLKIPVNNYNNIIEESMGKIDKIVNYIKNWYDDINKEIGEKVDNAFEAVLNVTNVNLDDDFKNNSKSNFGY